MMDGQPTMGDKNNGSSLSSVAKNLPHEAFILRLPINALLNVSEIVLPQNVLSDDDGGGGGQAPDDHHQQAQGQHAAILLDEIGATVGAKYGAQCDSSHATTTILRFPSDTVQKESVDLSSSQDHATQTVGKRITIEPRAQLKELGQKARARLENERARRREIVVLEETDQPLPPQQKKAKRKGPGSSLIPTRKRTRRAHASDPAATPTSAGRSRRRRSKSIDHYQPDISHIPSIPRETCSTIVQLHGLPTDATPEAIRRFFSGLKVESIFTILPNPHRIPILDATQDDYVTPAIARLPSTTRIFAKFKSAPAAMLAVQRSSEPIATSASQDGVITKATIGVTGVEKVIGAFLFQHLSRTAMVQHPVVDAKAIGVLWSHVNRELRLFPSSSPVLLAKNVELSTPLSQYQLLSNYYNDIADLEDRMVYQVASGEDARFLEKAIGITNSELQLVEKRLYRLRLAVKEQRKRA